MDHPFTSTHKNKRERSEEDQRFEGNRDREASVFFPCPHCVHALLVEAKRCRHVGRLLTSRFWVEADEMQAKTHDIFVGETVLLLQQKICLTLLIYIRFSHYRGPRLHAKGPWAHVVHA